MVQIVLINFNLKYFSILRNYLDKLKISLFQNPQKILMHCSSKQHFESNGLLNYLNYLLSGV